ncbi:dermonecrotic toxin domain-containing protein [Pseudomonas sp. FSL W7-0098]|uniref:dermonecrotic toxin domain-containing protein n=1 Tax=Pseudomonas sp. FSL W7-0098 TaxID=2496120 RepID=UPI00110D0A77|nr:DUF6543 domain-containing protein [Pseudomonas sp. FSL W7-0098]
MKTLSTTPDAMIRYSALSSFAGHSFALRPTFQGVVASWFKQALQDKYPALNVDFTQLAIAEPLSHENSPGMPRRYRFMAVADVMIQCFIDSTPVVLIQGFHRLSVDKNELSAHPLAVNMAELQSIINDHSGLLIAAYQQALAEFWSDRQNGSLAPLQWLSEVLRMALGGAALMQNRVPALPADQAVVLAVVASFPDRDNRARGTLETPVHAYLVNIDGTENNVRRRFQLPGVVLITRQMPDHLIVLGYSLEHGVESFSSVQAFATCMLTRVLQVAPVRLLSWSLHEPEGDFITGLARTLLDQQLRNMVRVGQAAQAGKWSVGRLEQVLDEAAAMFPFFSEQERPHLENVISVLPEWLKQASSVDQLDYSRLMSAEVIWQRQTRGRTFLDGIDALPVYAEKMIRQRIERDHPRSGLDISHIEIHDVGVENLQLPVFSDDVLSFVEFVLGYRGGWPVGLIAVKDRTGAPVPDWLTSGYVKSLVDELDVGVGYIALLKGYLVDDDKQVMQREALYAAQLRIQLPLLALEKKIRGQAGFTPQGLHVVTQVMRHDAQRSVSHDYVCVRPLGFYAYEGARVDTAANMFVFGSLNIQTGPFILYRPFAPEPLLEYASWPALFDAIKHPGELQESILTWLDDDARGYYADGGFARPHLENVLLEGFLALLPRRPATLSTRSLVGNYYGAMFDANVSALMSMADNQTVTTSERRWMLLKHYGWSLFNGLTFFLSGPLQKAAWLFQTLLSLDSGLQARIDGDKEAGQQTVIDLLFNISLALLHEGLRFKAKANARLRLSAPVDEPLFTIYKPEALPAVEPVSASVIAQKKQPDIEPRAASQYSSLDFSWFSAQPRLTELQQASLDTFVLDLDLSQGTRIEVGPLKGVINHEGKSYVQIGAKTYRVGRDADGLVIQDDRQPERFGPRLRRDEAGQWQLDLRLGLRGGGPKKTIQALREKKTQKVAALQQEAERLDEELLRRDRVLKLTEELLTKFPDRRATFVDRYEAELEAWRAGVLDMINVKTRSNQIIPLEGFEARTQETWVQLTLRLFKLQNYLEEALRELPVSNSRVSYTASLLEVLAEINNGSSAPYERWITNLKQAERLEARLYKNSLRECDALDEVRTRPLPRYSALEEIINQPNRDYFDRHWSAAYLETLCELVIRRDAVNLIPEEQYAFDLFGQGTLIDTAWSQLSLRREETKYPGEHLDFFDKTIEKYDAAEGVCQNLVSLGSEHFRNEYLPDIIEVLSSLRTFAEAQMQNVIRESESSSSEAEEPRPGPSRLINEPGAGAGSSRGTQQVIKTTKNLTLVGQRRPPSSGSEDEIVDVTEGIDQMNIRSYRKTEAGEWEEIGSSRPPTLQASQAKSLSRLQADARTLLERISGVIAQNRASAATSRIPIEIEEILSFKASSLDEVAQKIERIVLTSSPEVEPLNQERRTGALALITDLKAAAGRLRAEGRSLRISIIKRLPPTGANVEYLKAQGEVNITRVGRRRFLSKGQRKDYLEEYAISTLDGNELWFAHFHYKAMDTLAADFDVAHLKTAQQRTLSEQALYARAQSSHDYIAVYRAKLDRAMAQRLFLSLP